MLSSLNIDTAKLLEVTLPCKVNCLLTLHRSVTANNKH